MVWKQSFISTNERLASTSKRDQIVKLQLSSTTQSTLKVDMVSSLLILSGSRKIKNPKCERFGSLKIENGRQGFIKDFFLVEIDGK